MSRVMPSENKTLICLIVVLIEPRTSAKIDNESSLFCLLRLPDQEQLFTQVPQCTHAEENGIPGEGRLSARVAAEKDPNALSLTIPPG